MSEHLREHQLRESSRSRRCFLGAGGCLTMAGVIAGGALPAGIAAVAQAQEMPENERIVRAFIADWSMLDAQTVVAYFTSDGVYHNMMLPPVAGHEQLLKFIGSFLEGWSETRWEVVNLLSRGDLVVAERVDHTRIGDKRVSLPCVGIFEMRDGKISVWRDYFDQDTYRKAFAS